MTVRETQGNSSDYSNVCDYEVLSSCTSFAVVISSVIPPIQSLKHNVALEINVFEIIF